MNRTKTRIRATVHSLAASILATAFLLTITPAHAEFVSRTMNVLDTDTGLEWRKFGALASQGAYNDALGKYEAGSTYRLPTAAEVDNLLSKFFPGFVANDVSGRCAEGSNPQQYAQALAFHRLFGTNVNGSIVHAMYQDVTGRLRALHVYVSSTSNSGDFSRICPARDNYYDYFENYRATAPRYPATNNLVLVVRDAVDVKAPVITLYNYVHPNDIGLQVPGLCNNGNPYDCVGTDGSDAKWLPTAMLPDYTGQSQVSQFSLYSNPSEFAAGKSAPWIRLRSIDFTPVPNSGGACTSSTDTTLPNGLCRRSFVGNYYPWHLTAANAVVPGSNIYNQYVFSPVTVDNVVVEQIWENMTVDFAPTTTDNPIRPKGLGWSVYIAIKATSVAAGDDYDINPAYVDPATLKLGKNLAPVLNYQASDVDGDGDKDYTYQFNTGATGVTCLDKRITLTGKTYWGVNLAGYDTVVPLGCTETILMDVDPFNATNTIRPNDNYNVTVAILGMRTASGDAINLFPESNYAADDLDRSSLKLGPAATPLVGTPIVTDIDGDANSDLLVNFNVFNAGIACGDTQVQLQGNKISGIPIMAIDTIVTTDCETGGCHP